MLAALLGTFFCMDMSGCLCVYPCMRVHRWSSDRQRLPRPAPWRGGAPAISGGGLLCLFSLFFFFSVSDDLLYYNAAADLEAGLKLDYWLLFPFPLLYLCIETAGR